MKTQHSTPKIVGLQFDKAFLVDSNGELHPVFNHVSIMPGAPNKPGTDRQLTVSFSDVIPDLIAGALGFLKSLPGDPTIDLTAKPKTDATKAPSEPAFVPPDAIPGQDRTTSVAKPKRGAVELFAAFQAMFDEHPVADLTKANGKVPGNAIALLKKDPAWAAPRLFLFSAALEINFPDRTDRRQLVAHLKTMGIIKANTRRTDTDTITVQVNGKGRKAYRLNRKKLRQHRANRG